jgi:4-hydroxy-tetrahydrodipicolinate reductase
MRIALIGYGKMGKMIEQITRITGHSIAVIVDPLVNDTDFPAGIPAAKTITEASLINADSIDVAIEFTQPASAVTNLIALAERKIPTVTGTTGWFERLNEVTQAVEAASSVLLWASNFSIGVNLFNRIAWYAAELVDNFPEYDIGGFESHHNKKLDSPSGTAKTLAEGVLSRINRKKKIVWDTIDRKPQPDELHFPSLRMGNVPGTHSLFFDSSADTIEITHTARSREGFASGAVRAAEWLAFTKQKRNGVFTGVYTVDDMLKDILKI